MKNKAWLRRTFGAAVWLVIIGTLWAIIWPVFKRAQENASPMSCPSNLKQVSLGMLQYEQDYDHRYPQVNVNDAAITPDRPLGWADALQPYLKSIQIFQCPSEGTSPNPNPTETDYTDYWYNARLAGANASKIKHKETIILLGDGNDGTDATNARYSLSSFPSNWRKGPGFPARRHLEGAIYAFTDGHTKWLKPEQVSNEKPDGKNTTFAIR